MIRQAMIATFLALACATAHAEEALNPITLNSNELREKLDAAKVFTFEYGVPANPATAIIGASGEAIPTTASLQRFAFSVLNATESAGGGAAYGLDVAPMWAFGQTRSLSDYQDGNIWSRRLYRLRVSSAFAEGDSAKKSPSRAAIGLTASLLDSSDAAMQRAADGTTPLFTECTVSVFDERQTAYANKQSLLKARFDNQPSDAPLTVEAYNTQRAANTAEFAAAANIRKLSEDCSKKVVDQARRSAAWDVGAALQWTGRPGALDELEAGGGTAWTTYMTRAMRGGDAGPNAVVTRGAAHLRLDWDRADTTKAGVTVEYDRAVGSIGVERLGPKASWSIQAAYEHYDGPGGSEFDGNAYRYLAKVDYQLAENVWLVGALGAVEGRGVAEDTYTTVGLRFKAPKVQSLFAE